MTSRLRLVVACLATAAVLLPLAWLWTSSLLPDEYSVMDMGYADFGGGPSSSEPDAHAGIHAYGTSIAELTADPDRRADVSVDLRAEQGTFELASGRKVEGYTLNGRSPVR